MSRLHEALDRVSERAPYMQVAPGFYRSARRRHRLRLAGAVVSVVAVIALVALVAPATILVGRTSGGIGDGGVGGPPGIPDRITTPPWYTETASGAPAGPASVVFSGDVAQA